MFVLILAVYRTRYPQRSLLEQQRRGIENKGDGGQSGAFWPTGPGLPMRQQP
jgi:hypothetical protein